jgi:hypothetical protein
MDLDEVRKTLSSPRRDDDWSVLHDRFEGDPAAILGELIPRAVVDPTDPNAPQPDPVVVDRLRNATSVLLRLSQTPDADVSAQDEEDLALLSLIAGRPAIPVSGSSVTSPPPQWDFLDRARIEKRLPSVGRIDAVGKQVGTGFVVSAGVVMTNRHVARGLLAKGTNDAMPADAVIDFGHDLTGSTKTARIVEALWISDDDKIDAALLRIEGQALPPPLRVQTKAPASIANNLVYAIGYPFIDNEGNTPEEVMAAIFGKALGIKRVQPGMLKSYDTIDNRRMKHDCSTLGGSSGSWVIDYTTGVVWGLHFSGLYKRRNLAAALWAFADHEQVRNRITPG